MNYPKHIVATASLILNTEGQVLLVKTERRGWEMPGGQVEEGEDVLSALKREVLEESGVSIEILKLSAVYSSIDEPSKVIFDFVSEYTKGVPKKDNKETLDVGWFSKEEALACVERDAMKSRLRWLLKNSKGIRYASYSKDPFTFIAETVFNKE
ncbi:MAG: NUDIX hydrolase [Candidatus Moraniibacteriota bacterium]